MLQANDYKTKVGALPASQPTGTTSSAEVVNVQNALSVLLDLAAGQTTGFNLGKRLTAVSNIRQALSDLRTLHTDSLVSPQGSLQLLLENLTA